MNCQQFRKTMMLDIEDSTPSEFVAMIKHGNGCPACRKAWNDAHEARMKERGYSPFERLRSRLAISAAVDQKLEAARSDREAGTPRAREQTLRRVTEKPHLISCLSCEDMRLLEGSADALREYPNKEAAFIEEQMEVHLTLCRSCRTHFFDKYGGVTSAERKETDELQTRMEKALRDAIKEVARTEKSLDVNLTGAKTHHFLPLSGVTLQPIMLNDKKEVMVYLSRKQAEKDVRKRYGKGVSTAIIGMGDEKWALFRNEIPHVVVPREEEPS
jgi:hypothetical protein